MLVKIFKAKDPSDHSGHAQGPEGGGIMNSQEAAASIKARKEPEMKLWIILERYKEHILTVYSDESWQTTAVFSGAETALLYLSDYIKREPEHTSLCTYDIVQIQGQITRNRYNLIIDRKFRPDTATEEAIYGG